MSLMPMIDAAPDVNTLCLKENGKEAFALDPRTKAILTNPKIEDLYKPLQGPLQPTQTSLSDKFGNHLMGNVEKQHMSHFAFEEQYQSFHNFGIAENPNKHKPQKRFITSSEIDVNADAGIQDRVYKHMQKAKRRKGVDDAAGPDDDDEDDEEDDIDPDVKNQWGGWQDARTVRDKMEREASDRQQELERQKEEERAVEGEDRETKERVTSTFHGKSETTLTGRSWMETTKEPKPIDPEEQKCFLPKKWIHTWSGHTMGVQAIRWFPKTAHLLLSAGMDAKIKIWDYANQRKCMRTYTGHDQAVRDIKFTADGARFYSCSFDKNIQQWDTETGQIISTLTNKKTPYCIAVHPDPKQQNVFIIGCSNKKAVQFDANTSSIVQEYDEHLGAVNTVTFCEDGRRLLTSADDKKIFLWEYGIPVVVRHIAEPTMHSIPAMTLTPDEKFIAGQSMDNKIVVYEARGRFKFIGRKTFKGHINSGYAISPGFSADGRFIMSGDADGKLWFWDWNKLKNYRVIKAHDGVCIMSIWHPHHLSRVVTCGWDGAIKLWD